MKRISILMLIVISGLGLLVVAQDDMKPPPPLKDDMMQWMVGEWK